MKEQKLESNHIHKYGIISKHDKFSFTKGFIDGDYEEY